MFGVDGRPLLLSGGVGCCVCRLIRIEALGVAGVVGVAVGAVGAFGIVCAVCAVIKVPPVFGGVDVGLVFWVCRLFGAWCVVLTYVDMSMLCRRLLTETRLWL